LRELLAHRAQVEAIRGREAMATYLSNKGKEHSDSFAASSSYKPRELIPDNSVASDRSEKKHRPSASIALAIEDTVVPPPSKKTKINKKVTNFLGVGAQKAKAARTARKKAQVGMISTSNSVKLSHTGTGLPVDQVIRFKYQKGFTQAVKTPCRVEDLL
jgi:chromosome transmission fidelity protein 18